MAAVEQNESAANSVRKTKRVLACVLCQHRKVKCDRKFPCANCQKAGAQCIPAALIPRQRRRRFPERELLDRLRQYEDLLRKNDIKFEPLHAGTSSKSSANTTNMDENFGDDSATEDMSPPKDGKTEHSDEATYMAKNYWKAMIFKPQGDGLEPQTRDEDSSPDDVQEKVILNMLDETFEGEEQIFFGTRSTSIDLSTLHPEQSRIFKLWQIYLENVDPLLKVTHTPSLQPRIVDAAGDITRIEPTLEALMFSIYCIAIHTLGDTECNKQFGLSSRDLLRTYQFGCQQALLNCNFSKTENHECLTALTLYLISLKPTFDPRALFSLTGVAVRIAKRMGIHIEATNARENALTGELRRRLWWALIMYDDRLSEMSKFKDAALSPTWDCKTPSNLNDVDFRAEMKATPATRNEPTEAIFAVVRAEIGDFQRRSLFHLDFTNPILKTFMTDISHGPIRKAGELFDLQKMIEEKYLKHCNPEIPLHFMLVWVTRLSLAKKFIMNEYSKHSAFPDKQTDEQKDTTLGYALQMLEADTVLTKSPVCVRFTWYLHLYFPFPAYVHVIHDLRRRPGGKVAEKGWKILNDNYDVRFLDGDRDHRIFFRVFSKAVKAAWKARETFLRTMGQHTQPPPMITSIELITAQMGLTSLDSERIMNSSTPDTPAESITPASFFDTADDGTMSGLSAFALLPADYWNLSQSMEVDNSQFNWSGPTWAPAPAFSWQS